MTNPTFPSVCPRCGAEFFQSTKYRRRVYCSHRCTKRAVNKRYRDQHPDLLLTKSRTYYAENKEAILDRVKSRADANGEARGAKMKEWRAANPQKAVQLGKQNYALLRASKPWCNCLHAARKRSEQKKTDFSLTHVWASSVWTGSCEISGLPFDLDRTGKSGARMRSPSIDRIDNSRGYEPDNCRFILQAINAFKYDGTDAEMLVIAKAIVKSLSPP